MHVYVDIGFLKRQTHTLHVPSTFIRLASSEQSHATNVNGLIAALISIGESDVGLSTRA
jgi:hypothetical protein